MSKIMSLLPIILVKIDGEKVKWWQSSKFCAFCNVKEI